jgi:copper(I)-binding protein
MRTLSFALAAVLAATAVSAQAATYRLGAIEVAKPWSRPAAAGTTGAGFMTVTNTGKTAQTLVSVESPLASKAEMHVTSTTGGVMRMQRLDKGVAIPAGGSVTFAPGGYHVMLIGLTKALKGGDTVPATLHFAGGANLKVEFQVGTAAPMDMEHMHH